MTTNRWFHRRVMSALVVALSLCGVAPPPS